MELIKWNEIQAAINKAENWDEIKETETKLKAIQLIVSQERMAIPVKNKVTRYLIDIEAKKGEWLSSNVKRGRTEKEVIPIRLADLNISKDESSQAQRLSKIPKIKRDEILDKIEDDGKEITKTELTRRINTSEDRFQYRSQSSEDIYNVIQSRVITQLRENLNIKREQVAADLNASTSAIWNVENVPFHNPNIKLIMKLARYFDVDIRDLIDMGNIKVEPSPIA